MMAVARRVCSRASRRRSRRRQPVVRLRPRRRRRRRERAAMASDVSGEEFNVGSGTEASVREIVERLIEITGADVEPEYRPDAAC